MPEAGEVLAGRYRLLEPLGQGGMGTVWRAEHVELGSQVAVKLIAEGVAQGETTLGRFKREAKAAAALASPHIVQIFDYGVDQNRPYIAMELLEGESLAHRLKVKRTLPAEQTARMLTQIAKAMDKAHKAGILHRDLKPDNVFICTSDDDEDTVKILDFGVAKALKPDVVGNVSSHTRTGALVGSPFYMSPEQIRGQKTIDHRADLWSIAVMIYECLVGKRPFEGESLGDLVMTVCSDPIPVPSERGCKLAGFDGWFAKACARGPDERFQSGREMANALRALLGQTVMDEETRDSLGSVSTPPPARDAGPVEIISPPMVPTADGLSRTQDERRPPPPRATGKLVLVALGAGVLVTAVALVGLLGPWSGSGDPAAGSAAPTTSVETKAPPSASASAPSTATAVAPTAQTSAPSASAAASATAAPSSPAKTKAAPKPPAATATAAAATP